MREDAADECGCRFPPCIYNPEDAMGHVLCFMPPTALEETPRDLDRTGVRCFLEPWGYPLMESLGGLKHRAPRLTYINTVNIASLLYGFRHCAVRDTYLHIYIHNYIIITDVVQGGRPP